jgi:GTP-binding protein
MVIGEHNLESDMEMNSVKAKATSNIRVTGAVEVVARLQAPKTLGLEEAIAYIRQDELVEVTPKHIRMRKKILSQSVREKVTRDNKSGKKNK